VKEAIDIGPLVRDAGFLSGDKPGGVVVAPNGGSALFYTHDSDRETADRLAKWLMSQPWCGALMASDAVAGIEGTVPASVAGMQGERTPELAMSFRWDSVKNEAGYAGHAFSTSLGPGQGQHGSMSRHETHNVLFARGPSFKEELSIDNPTGNIDLAPTVLNILGLSGGEDMDGRILWEALRDGPDPEAVQWRTDTHEAERAVDDGTYRQYVKVSSVGKTTYVDEGLGRVGA